mmetsp:Transcript_23152/g.72135  ORF Transcript_23152/g.72135 Transcript_23152/m.72135 type:complete len:380 (+) Transcript_23152:1368-2507(+)
MACCALSSIVSPAKPARSVIVSKSGRTDALACMTSEAPASSASRAARRPAAQALRIACCARVASVAHTSNLRYCFVPWPRTCAFLSRSRCGATPVALTPTLTMLGVQFDDATEPRRRLLLRERDVAADAAACDSPSPPGTRLALELDATLPLSASTSQNASAVSMALSVASSRISGSNTWNSARPRAGTSADVGMISNGGSYSCSSLSPMPTRTRTRPPRTTVLSLTSTRRSSSSLSPGSLMAQLSFAGLGPSLSTLSMRADGGDPQVRLPKQSRGMPFHLVFNSDGSSGGRRPTVSSRSLSGQPSTCMKMGSRVAGQPSTSQLISSTNSPGMSLKLVISTTAMPQGGSTPAAGRSANAAPLYVLSISASSSLRIFACT